MYVYTFFIFACLVYNTTVGCSTESKLKLDDSMISLRGGRKSRNNQSSFDGYAIVTKKDGLSGYLCSATDDKTLRQIHADAICRHLCFQKAYDVPIDNRYGTPENTSQPYQITCDTECRLEKMSTSCQPEHVLSVWCIKDYSFRLVTDDTEKLVADGFVTYYLKGTWFKMRPRSVSYNEVCQELGFVKKHQHRLSDRNKKILKNIPAESNYKFGNEKFYCNVDEVSNCTPTWVPAREYKNKNYSDWINCTTGPAQAILDRIQPRFDSGFTTSSISQNTTSGNMNMIVLGVVVAVLVVIIILIIIMARQRKVNNDRRYAEVDNTSSPDPSNETKDDDKEKEDAM
ncbi:uncharacterized protein [Antedon mediterranea]|uniref:uncharacterized protein isoform X2 n=1 Tax=Antedon mediterranea TaxID=105859 RepID=UPI003AF61257